MVISGWYSTCMKHGSVMMNMGIILMWRLASNSVSFNDVFDHSRTISHRTFRDGIVFCCLLISIFSNMSVIDLVAVEIPTTV